MADAEQWTDNAAHWREQADVTVESLPADATLEARAASINRHIDLFYKAAASANSHRIRAGHELIEVRKLVPAGEWLSWCAANIKRGQRDVQRLIKIAASPDPVAALQQERAAGRESMAKTRANATNSLSHDVDPPTIEGELVDVTPPAPVEPEPVTCAAQIEPEAEALSPAEALFVAIGDRLNDLSHVEALAFRELICGYVEGRITREAVAAHEPAPVVEVEAEPSAPAMTEAEKLAWIERMAEECARAAHERANPPDPAVELAEKIVAEHEARLGITPPISPEEAEEAEAKAREFLGIEPEAERGNVHDSADARREAMDRVVNGPTVIKQATKKAGAVTRLTPAEYEARKRAEAEAA